MKAPEPFFLHKQLRTMQCHGAYSASVVSTVPAYFALLLLKDFLIHAVALPANKKWLGYVHCKLLTWII